MDDFDACYAAHYRGLTIQLYAYFGDRQEAQDVVQEAFCRAYARWSRISRYDDPVAWVRRVAWNLAKSRTRRVRTALRYAPMLHRRDSAPGPTPSAGSPARRPTRSSRPGPRRPGGRPSSGAAATAPPC